MKLLQIRVGQDKKAFSRNIIRLELLNAVSETDLVQPLPNVVLGPLIDSLFN